MCVLRVAALAAVISAAVRLALAATLLPCSAKDFGYTDPDVLQPNGGVFLPDALECRTRCQALMTCKVFTFYVTSGGCWLQGITGRTPVLTNITGVISGPRDCAKEEAASVAATTAIMTTAATFATTAAPSGVAPTTNGTNQTAGSSDENEFSDEALIPIPMWALVAGIGGVVAFGLSLALCRWSKSSEHGHDKTKKKEKDRLTRGTFLMKEENDEAQPLMANAEPTPRTEAPAAVVEPPATTRSTMTALDSPRIVDRGYGSPGPNGAMYPRTAPAPWQVAGTPLVPVYPAVFVQPPAAVAQPGVGYMQPVYDQPVPHEPLAPYWQPETTSGQPMASLGVQPAWGQSQGYFQPVFNHGSPAYPAGYPVAVPAASMRSMPSVSSYEYGQLFDQLDRNADGVLSIAELQQLIGAQRQQRL